MHPAFKMTTQEWQRQKLGPDNSRTDKWISVELRFVLGPTFLKVKEVFLNLEKPFEDMIASFKEFTRALGSDPDIHFPPYPKFVKEVKK